MIFVRKATAGPAENRHFYLLESLDNVPAHAVYVGDRRVLAHINAVIDTSSQMLGKMTVYLGIDVSLLSFALISIDIFFIYRILLTFLAFLTVTYYIYAIYTIAY